MPQYGGETRMQPQHSPQDPGFFERLKEQFDDALHRKLTFLITGRTGVGKSSTVNTLIGQEIAEVGAFEAATRNVKLYRVDIHGIRCEVVDTPGLCDQEGDENDQAYIADMKRSIAAFDSLWF